MEVSQNSQNSNNIAQSIAQTHDLELTRCTSRTSTTWPAWSSKPVRRR